ncbi:hypothetical protein HanPI659440_Chr11g0430871 [Helianthus annuus]|nr:hypothetical protein HanPI659440_Chr11g0430871 [Helianthus annuus]
MASFPVALQDPTLSQEIRHYSSRSDTRSTGLTVGSFFWLWVRQRWCLWLVDILDYGIISPDLGTLDYKGPYKVVGKALLRIHAEGQRKSVITPKSKLCCGA